MKSITAISVMLAFSAVVAYPARYNIRAAAPSHGFFPKTGSIHPTPAHILNIEGTVFPAPTLHTSARPEYDAYDYPFIQPRKVGNNIMYIGAADISNVQPDTMYRVKYGCPSGQMIGCNCHGLSCARSQGTWILPDGKCQCDYWGTEAGCSETSGVDIVCVQ